MDRFKRLKPDISEQGRYLQKISLSSLGLLLTLSLSTPSLPACFLLNMCISLQIQALAGES